MESSRVRTYRESTMTHGSSIQQRLSERVIEVTTMPVQPIVFDEEALDAIARLADENRNLHEVIIDLGQRVLNLPGVGLRQRTPTYDIAFVRPRTARIPRSRRKAFATFITPTHQGVWTPAPPRNRLFVGVRVNPGVQVEDPSGLLQERDFASQGGGGWHDVYVREDGSDTDAAIDILAQAHRSFD